MAAVAPFDLAAWAAALHLSPQEPANTCRVYLVTFARVLAATLAARPGLRDPSGWDREQIADAVRDSLNRPWADALRGGRPAQEGRPDVVLKLVVFREKHADGSYPCSAWGTWPYSTNSECMSLPPRGRGTDRQTDAQTDRHTQKARPTHRHTEHSTDRLPDAAR